MIFQVKDPGKTRAGKFRLAPGAVRFLTMNQVSHSFGNRGVFRPGACKQADESPRRLRSRAGSLPLGRRHVVAQERFAKASVHLLNAAEPTNRALAKLASGKRNGFEGAQNTARSINVIDAPASEPGTVLALILKQELHGTLDD